MRLDYKDSPTWITQFRVEMRKLCCLEDEKVGEKISALISNFLLLLWTSEREGIFKKRLVGKPKGSGTHLGWPSLAVPMEARGHHGKPPKWGLLSLVLLLAFFDRPLASKLGIRIYFRIMNHNSLRHEDYYTRLSLFWCLGYFEGYPLGDHPEANAFYKGGSLLLYDIPIGLDRKSVV